MKKNSLLILLGSCALALFSLQCSGGSDSKDIAQELDNQLTDSLLIDNGEVVKGEPPAPTDNPDAPQITEVVMPASLRLGDMFTITLKSNYVPKTVTKFGEGSGGAEDYVDKAIIKIGSATSYIIVKETLENGEMVLSGQIVSENNDELQGRDFSWEFALQTAGGLTGQYRGNSVVIRKENPPDVSEPPITLITIPGEVWNSNGRPEGEAGAAAPQIEELVDAPKTVQPKISVTFGMRVGAYAGDIAAVLITTPTSKGYKRTEVFDYQAALRKSVSGIIYISINVTEEAFDGSLFVLLLALESNTGSVGKWYPWEFKVQKDIPCENCAAGMGGMSVSLLSTPSDLGRLTLNLNTTPAYSSTVSVGPGQVINQQFTDIPVGKDLTVILDGLTTIDDPDKDMTIYRAIYKYVDILEGKVSSIIDLIMDPVTGDVPFEAAFPQNDLDADKIKTVKITVAGARIDSDKEYTFDKTSGTLTLAVGSRRVAKIKTFDAGNKLLHEGVSAEFKVTEKENELISVSMTNKSATGQVDVSGNTCTPDCADKQCGGDGCGGSCGGCKPNETCSEFKCVETAAP